MVHFDRGGDGPPLILIHGIAHRWQAWEPVLAELRRHHDVIALDLPGFGRSPRVSKRDPRSIHDVTAQLVEFFRACGVSRPHVAGNSLGGALALELAATGHAASATALSPAGFGTHRENWTALGKLSVSRATTCLPTAVLRRSLRSEAVRRTAFATICDRPALLSAERALGDALAMRRGKGYFWYAWALRPYAFAGSPEVPVTVAWAERDRILLPHQAARARAALPAARHVVLDGCGHVPMSDDPALVASVILTTTGAVPAS
jgi:pimeloyl-ACP methyl ester carboxylesterase